MGTARDHQAGKPKGRVWSGYKQLDAYRAGRQDTIVEANEVLAEKGEPGLAAWARRLKGA